MRSKVLLFAGVFMMAAGAFSYFLIDHVFGTVAASSAPVELGAVGNLLRYGIGGLFTGVGAIFTVRGLVGMVQGSKNAKLASHIMQSGTEAEATVTLVDKNYSLLVNNRPVYSIVEYNYVDGSGTQHTNRIDNLNSELVIRMKIQVGATIAVKYSAHNPAESVIVT